MLPRLVALALLGLSACIPVHTRYLGPLSDHFDGTRFQNLRRVPRREVGDFFVWKLTARERPWDRARDTRPGPPPPAAVTDGIRVTPVGHATLLVQLDGVNILTDPIWSERGSPFADLGPRRRRPPAVRFGDLPRIDAVVVSHDHYDHMDVPTLRRLAARHHPLVLAGLNNAAYLAWVGVTGAVDLDWWQCVQVGAVTVCAVPAQHDSGRGLSDRAQSLWEGFWIAGPSGSLYFAGDTGLGPHFAEIRRRMGPVCVALLPIGAYLPRWFMRPIHMSPDDAVRAYQILEARHGVPMHHGTLDLSDEGRLQPLQDLARSTRRRGARGFEPVPFGESRTFRCRSSAPPSAAPPRP